MAGRVWYGAGATDPAEFHILPQLWEGTTITVPPESITTSPANKRYLTCLLAALMPEQGIDENFESALECWNFYADRPTPPALPSGGSNPVKTKFAGFSTRPGLVLAE